MKLIGMLMSAIAGAVVAGIAFDKYTDGIVSDVLKDAIDPSDEEDDEEEEVEPKVDCDKKYVADWSDPSELISADDESREVIIGSRAFIGLLNCLGHKPDLSAPCFSEIQMMAVPGKGIVYRLDYHSAKILYCLIEHELMLRGDDSYTIFGDDGIYFERLYDALDSIDVVTDDIDVLGATLANSKDAEIDKFLKQSSQPHKEDEIEEAEEEEEDEDDKWDWDGEEPDDNDPNDPGSYLIYSASEELIHMDKYFAHDFMSVLGFNRLSDTDFDHYVMTLDDAFKLTRIMCALYSLDDLNFPAFTRLNDTLKTLNDDGRFIIFENGLEFDPDESPNTEIIGDRILMALIKAIGFRDINVTNVISHDDALKLADLICPDGKPFNDPNRFGTKFTENEINFINHFVDHVHEVDDEDEAEEEETEKQGIVDINYVTVEETPTEESPKSESEE